MGVSCKRLKFASTVALNCRTTKKRTDFAKKSHLLIYNDFARERRPSAVCTGNMIYDNVIRYEKKNEKSA